MKTTKKMPSMLLSMLIIGSLFTTSCYYSKDATDSKKKSSIEQLQGESQYVVLHRGDDIWNLNNISFNQEKSEITGTIVSLSDDNSNYSMKSEGHTISEAHLYITEFTEEEQSGITIPVASIRKIEIYDKKGVVNASNNAGIIIGIGAAILGVILLVVALGSGSY